MGLALVKFERDQRQDTLHDGPTYLDILVELERLEISTRIEETQISKDGVDLLNLETKIKKERENYKLCKGS